MKINSNEIGESAIKSFFAVIPFAGQVLNEVFYEYRGRVKQDRLNEFTALLAEYFQKNVDVDLTTLNWLEFSDLLESVILRVSRTGSKQKQMRFRDIITNYIENPHIDLDYTETYLELISTLNENAIRVLSIHAKYHESFLQNADALNKIRTDIHNRNMQLEEEKILSQKGFANNVIRLQDDIENLRDQQNIIEQEKEILETYQTHEFYGLSEDEYQYLKQMLSTKALMLDFLIGTFDYVAFKFMRITEFGKEFVRFVIKDEVED